MLALQHRMIVSPLHNCMLRGWTCVAVDLCTELQDHQVDGFISCNVNSLKWTGDCFYGLETFIEALADQVTP